MSALFLVTTSSEELQPLGTAAQRSFELVTGALRARLGEDAALLLAEPVAAEGGERIDWYAQIPGRARRLADLETAEQEAVRETLDSLVSGIRDEAGKLELSKDPADLRLGEALANAVEVPDEASIHVVVSGEGRLYPVLVSWAWVRETQAAVRGVLKGRAARPRPGPAVAPAAPTIGAQPAAPASPAIAARSRATAIDPRGWLLGLGWLILTGMIAAILWLLVQACGLHGTALVYCAIPPAPAATAETEQRVIEAQVATLERELALARGACRPDLALLAPPPPEPALPPQPAPPPALAPPQDEQSNEIDRRLDSRGAQRGDLTFTLIWDGPDDVDLHVTCPTGQQIGFRNRNVCNGWLDVDANAGNPVNDPVENIVFNSPQAGAYRIRVNLYSSRTGRPRPFTVRVIQRDGSVQTFSGTIRPGNATWTQSITIR
jgi:hypothetical protein